MGTTTACETRFRWRRLCTLPVVAASLTALFGCSHNLASQWNKPFFFVQLADTQLGMASKNTDCKKESGLFEAAVTRVNRLKPAFVVICGDLINQPGNAEQAAEFHRIAGRLDNNIPLHLVAGNHELGNKPTRESVAWYQQQFGADRYGFDYSGCRFLVLNSGMIESPDLVADEYDEQQSWLHDQLDSATKRKAVHIIVFQHHPYFINQPDEADGYYNIPAARRQTWLTMLSDANCTAVFAGHYHRNADGHFSRLEMITTASVTNPFGETAPGFRIVKVFHDRLEHTYIKL